MRGSMRSGAFHLSGSASGRGGGRVTRWADAVPRQPAPGPASRSDVLGPPSLPASPPLRPPAAAAERLARLVPRPGGARRRDDRASVREAGHHGAVGAGDRAGRHAGHGHQHPRAVRGHLPVPAHAPQEGVLQRDLEPDPEKAKPSVLRSAQQVSGRGSRLPRARVGVSWPLRRGSGWEGMVGVLLCATEPGWEWGQRTGFGQRMCSEALGLGQGVPKAWGGGVTRVQEERGQQA